MALGKNIEAALAALTAASGNHAALAQLKAALTEADPAAAAEAIRQFLASGRDSATGLGFELSEGGTLDEAPTLRVFLLDLLGALDPATALAVSREILTTHRSADEWAIAMRNVARGDATADGYLAGKVGEMLAWQPWRSAPSSGFFEAFDVIVHVRATQLLPQLTDLVEKETPLQRAANVALDRLAAASPLEVMSYLNSNPALLADKPRLRADFYAKADLTDATQRQLVETHLANPAVTFVEKEKIIESLGVTTGFVSENLLTPAPTPDSADDRQAAFQKTGGEWLRSGRFPELRATLQAALAP